MDPPFDGIAFGINWKMPSPGITPCDILRPRELQRARFAAEVSAICPEFNS